MRAIIEGSNKLQVMLLGLTLILGITTLLSVYSKKTPDHITLTLNGKNFVEPEAAIHQGQLMVPASFIKAALDMDVDWTERQKKKDASKPQAHYSDMVAVLMYHDLMEDPDRDGVIEVDHFREQMALLKSEDFHVIDVEQYLGFVLEGKPVPDNAVLITFDDGYESFYTYAFPVLKEYGYAAANFLIVSSIDKRRSDERPKLTWDQMREMKEAGMQFYSHTYDMHVYGSIDAKGKQKPVTTRHLYLEQEQRTENDQEYEQRIKADLTLAEQRLREELGNTRSMIAFPYGAFHEELLRIIHSIGIDVSFTVKDGVNTKLERNGYRINGGRTDLTPEQVINSLKEKALLQRVPLKGDDAEMLIDGESIHFSILLKGASVADTLIPLREFCKKFDIQVDWNHKKKRAVLTSTTRSKS